MAETRPFALMPKGGQMVLMGTFSTLEEARAEADKIGSKHHQGVIIIKLIELRYADISVTNKSFPLSE